MSDLPGHTSPPYSENSRADALFHYTSADGLLGILESGEIWSTAYYCLNDESELNVGKDFLTPGLRTATYEMIRDNDPLVQTFKARGVDIQDYADKYEQWIIDHAFHRLCTYVTCFCKPTGREDFGHGLLSQWRAYGADGGFAIQFSRKKLEKAVENANRADDLGYQLDDVYYTPENPLKTELLTHADSFLGAYMEHLKGLGKPLGGILQNKSISDPISGLLRGPLESLLDFLIQTKSPHFIEENECRLSLIEANSSDSQVLPTNYFNRGGLIVPYKKTPKCTFPILECIDWIVIGPNSRMDARFKSIRQMIGNAGLKIGVRPSHIPLSRT